MIAKFLQRLSMRLGMFVPIPAARFYILLAIFGAVSPLVAIALGRRFAIAVLLAVDAILVLAAFVDRGRARAGRVKISRQPLDKLSIGRENPVVLQIRASQKASSTTFVRVRDSYPTSFNATVETFAIALEPGSQQDATYAARPEHRGEYRWGNIFLRQLGPWGLAWYGWQVAAGQTVAVYPDLLALRELSVRLALENTGTMRQARRLGAGTEFSELREYRTGDSTRAIDWKATARRSRPIVRVLEPEQEQTLIILLDCGRLMTARVCGLKRFDWGLNAALALTLAGLNRGDKVGVGVFEREIVSWSPPQRGPQHLNTLIERLTPIQPVLREPDYFGVISQLVGRQNRRALVVLLTDIVDRTASAELLAAMARLAPRYLPFCVTLRDPQVDRLAVTPTELERSRGEVLDATYQRAVALDLMAQRQVAFAQLRQQGALVLDAPANAIGQELVNRYLQLKLRSLL